MCKTNVGAHVMAGGRNFQMVLAVLCVLVHFIGFLHKLDFYQDLEYSYSKGNTVFTSKSHSISPNQEFVHKLVNRKLSISKQRRPAEVNKYVCDFKTFCLLQLLILSGDVEANPGPVKYPCSLCRKPTKSNQKAIQCDFCDAWTHLKCTSLSLSQYQKLANSDETFYCNLCSDRLPNFSDSFFGTFGNGVPSSNASGSEANISHGSLSSDLENDENYDIFEELSSIKMKNPRRFLCAYLNINSLRYKICHIKELLQKRNCRFAVSS